MPKIITEDMIEQAAIAALQKQHSYTVLRCYTETPEALPDETGRTDKRQVVLPQVLLDSLCRINPDIPTDTVHAHRGRTMPYAGFRRPHADQFWKLPENSQWNCGRIYQKRSQDIRHFAFDRLRQAGKQQFYRCFTNVD